MCLCLCLRYSFLACCIECRLVIAMRILSVRLSVSLSVVVEISLLFVCLCVSLMYNFYHAASNADTF